MSRTRTQRWTHGGIDGVTATLDAPEQRNPLDHATVRSLRDELATTIESGARAFVVTGAGPAFSAGGDLRAYLDLYADADKFRAFLADFRALCDELETTDIVTVAMINGTCVAGGLELALACDFVVMSRSARIGDGHLGSGQIPGAGGSQRLYRAVGHQRAKRVLLAGDLLSADEAFAMGLVSHVVEPDALESSTLAIAAGAGRHSPLAYGNAKRMLRAAADLGLDDGLDREVEIVVGYATGSHDAREGLHAFLDRRPPEYRGE